VGSSCHPFCGVSVRGITTLAYPGCFAHYITLRQHDATFSRYEKANQWLVTFDALSGAMYNDGIYELQKYLPYMLVPFYPLFQERGGQRVEKSQTDWEVRKRLHCTPPPIP
jgi:hypothetical protein